MHPALRCSFRGGEPGVLLQETRFQPFPEHLLVHGDVRQEPFMADLIKASFDVPFENRPGSKSGNTRLSEAGFSKMPASSMLVLGI